MGYSAETEQLWTLRVMQAVTLAPRSVYHPMPFPCACEQQQQAKVKALMQHKAQRQYGKCRKGMMRLSKTDEHAPLFVAELEPVGHGQ